jgi:hypothetical protein
MLKEMTRRNYKRLLQIERQVSRRLAKSKIRWIIFSTHIKIIYAKYKD